MSSVVNSDEVTSSFSWTEWTTRLHAYVSWLNSQLKKQEGSRQITDLRCDLQDGVVLSQLVEALGGDSITGIDTNPTSPANRKDNVERIFQYLSSKHVPISNCRAKDVLAGDLKCMMRLIHAIASHYRPESVMNPPTNAIKNSNSPRWASSLAYLGEKNNNSKVTTTSSNSSSYTARTRTNRTFSPLRKVDELSSLPIRRQPLSIKDISKGARSLSPVSVGLKTNIPKKNFNSTNCSKPEDASNCKMTTGKDSNTRISCKVAPLQRSRGGTPPMLHSRLLSKKKNPVSRSEPCCLDSVDSKESAIVDKFEKPCCCSSLDKYDVDQMLNDIKDAKQMLISLQDVLLHGNGSKFVDDSDQGMPYGCANDGDSFSPEKVLKDQNQRDDCNNKRNRPLEPMSMACGERKKIGQEESRSTKTEPPDIKRNFKEENESLRKIMEDKDLEIKRLKIALDSCTVNSDKKIKYPYPLTTRTQREELQVVHEALSSLRKCFAANDPHQHTLDTIEQSLSALLERLNSLEIGATKPDAVLGIVRRTYYEAGKEELQTPISRITGLGAQQLEDTRNSTKVVYYMDKSATPFRCILNKSIGAATLRDFKLLFDRPGQFRYHFKTLDPEFGMVKEEVLQDDDILPSWDGKIIAWIEEDCS